MNRRFVEILKHTLGADDRYKKKNWGFRNHFEAEEGHQDYEDLLKMVDAGIMTTRSRLGSRCFFATKAGAVAIGFKPYQLRNAGLD